MKIQSSKLKIKSYKQIIGVITLHFVLCTLLLPKAHAQATSLKIEPSTLQIRATAPADIEAPFTIENPGDEAVELQVVFKNFGASGDESGKVVYTTPNFTENDHDPFLKNIHVLDSNAPAATISLGPQQEKSLKLHVSVPETTATGDHYISVVFITTPEEGTNKPDKDSTVSQVRQAMSIPVLLSVGQADAGGTLETFSAPWIMQGGPVPFTVRIENAGDQFLSVKGAILIKNMFGQVVGRVNIPNTDVLSQTTRLLSNTQTLTSLDQEKYQGKMVWPEKFLLGFYTATLTVAVSPQQTLYARDVYFFAFPMATLIVLVFLAIFGVVFYRRVKKKLAEE